MIDIKLLSQIDPATGLLEGATYVERYLSDLRGSFADKNAYEAALANGNPLLYRVGAIEPANGDGQLHYGVAILMPGMVGAEYYLTKGHLHAWRPAAEVYLGLAGEGLMLLEDEATGATKCLPLKQHGVVYVPGATAHRTINTGSKPLVYIGVYPSAAGHDYGAIATKNFASVVVAVADQPTVMERAAFLATLNT